MNSKQSFYVIGPIVLLFGVLISFSNRPNTEFKEHLVTTEKFDFNLDETTSSQNVKTIFPKYIFLERSYIGFKEAIAFKESQGKYHAVNTLGYLGKYQFGASTLELLGIDNPQYFLNTPELQEKAFLANTNRNKWVLRRDIKRFVGKKIKGIVITESGILAAAHLAGPGNVKRFLRSYGALGATDAYGTNIPDYMRKFSGYDTSFVKPLKSSKVGLP